MTDERPVGHLQRRKIEGRVLVPFIVVCRDKLGEEVTRELVSAFIRDLTEHATQEQFVYSHQWTQHDLVIWDNRATMHRVRRYDDLGTVRDLRRTTTRGDGPTAEQTDFLPSEAGEVAR